ncbi:MAG: hypothetical protein ACYC3I_22595 [Gemmataceae bacterium]
MRFWFPCSLVAIVIAAFSGNPISAQTIYGQNPSGSAVSPYLNLMRPGSLPAINYYDLVRPQMQFQNAISSLQMNQAAMIQGVTASGVRADALVMTGHPVIFGNYTRYFPGGIGSGGSNATGVLTGQRNLQNQRMMNSPLSGLGGAGAGAGFGGMSGSGMNPGISAPR